MSNTIELPDLNYNNSHIDSNKPYVMTKNALLKITILEFYKKKKCFDLNSHVAVLVKF